MVSTGLLRELRFDQLRQFVKMHWKHAPRTCADALMALLRTLISKSSSNLRIVLWEFLLDLANPRVDNLGKVFLNHDPSILDGKGGTRPLRKELLLDSDIKVMLQAFEYLNLPEGARDLIANLKSLGVDLPSLKKNTTSLKAQQGSYVRWQLENAGHLFPRICGRLDSRIETFRPDPWQRRLLDIVDQKKARNEIDDVEKFYIKQKEAGTIVQSPIFEALANYLQTDMIILNVKDNEKHIINGSLKSSEELNKRPPFIIGTSNNFFQSFQPLDGSG